MGSEDVIAEYMKAVEEQFKTGHAKEHAYRPALERSTASFDNVRPVNDPKRSEHGNPDMVFLNNTNNDLILGYCEAKDVDINLDKTEKSEQMKRYSGYNNLFLTNYLEFRFYVNGEPQDSIEVASIGLHVAVHLATTCLRHN